MPDRPPAIFLMGPTATGKTDLAVTLAEHLPVEVISVDSALVYRGMDIGSAKPDAAARARVPHHLIDIRDPSEPYSVADFATDVRSLMAQIHSRGRVPLLAGGTMLYFRVLREGLADLPPADPTVRDAILREAETYGWPALHAQLEKVDPESAAAIHPRHSQRIQRALEIYRVTGRPASAFKEAHKAGVEGIAPVTGAYHVVQLALVPHDRRLLHERIARRFESMLAAGLVEEVRALFERGDLTPDLPALRAVGYRQVWQYLSGDHDYDTMVEKGQAATRQLAKRQLTWLRRWPDLHHIDIDTAGGEALFFEEIVNKCLKVLRNEPIYLTGNKLI